MGMDVISWGGVAPAPTCGGFGVWATVLLLPSSTATDLTPTTAFVISQ